MTIEMQSPQGADKMIRCLKERMKCSSPDADSIKLNSKLKIVVVRLTAAEIEELTTNIRQTKITEYYKKVTKCNENHPQKNEILFQETIKENKPPKSASSPILIQRNLRKRSHEDSGNESSSCKSIKHDSKDDASSNLLSNKAKIEMTPIEPPKILSPAISLEEPYQVEKDMGHSIMEQKMRSILAWLNFPTKNSYETIANLEHKMDNMNYMDNLHSGRTAEFNQQCDKITTSQNENNELNIFNVQDNEMSKEGTNFDVKDFRRNLLVNLMLNGGMDEFEKNTYKKTCQKRFFEKKERQDRIQNTVLKKIRAKNPSVLLEIENYVDFEPFKEKFTYISKNIVTDGVIINDAPSAKCCSCKDNCQSEPRCCSNRNGAELAYDSKKCLRPGVLQVFECNKLCKCGPKCINRVVQLGSKISLCLFKSSTGKGWGLKTRESLLKGQFISEYVGEIISFDTANKNYEISNTHYVFEMNFYPSKKPYSIDATNYGNATRFINHSCTPNCIVYPVWYDTIDKNFPKLAFFSLRTIEKNEELTIDYSGGSDNQGQNLFLEDCKCEAPNCRKNIYV